MSSRSLPEKLARRNRRPETACLGKIAFETGYAAAMVASRSKGMNSYRCAYCHKWHVGHRPKAIGLTLDYTFTDDDAGTD